MAILGSMDIGSLHFWCLDRIWCEQMLILGKEDKKKKQHDLYF